MELPKKGALRIGDLLEVEIEKIAHGGHCIARHEGAVIFVRHAIPGERCQIEITSVGASFIRADVIEVLEPSTDRIWPACKFAHHGGCGGCDFQHINLARQRALKADVIAEQFLRIAKMVVNVEVEEVGDALHWRTRVSATSDSDGRLGFYANRSHQRVTIDDCLIATKDMRIPELALRKWPANVRIEIALSNSKERNIALAPMSGEGKARLTEGPQTLNEIVNKKTLQVSQSSFWQSHSSAPTVLTQVVLEFAQLISGDHVLDLYGGVGLFTSAMVDAVSLDGSIHLVEASKSATDDAVQNFKHLPQVKTTRGDVAKLLPRIDNANVIVLDPPREGAGKVVIAQIARLKPRAVVYVACDPAALARDTQYLTEHGYSLAKLRAFDLFPMTHHVECVALYQPN